MDQVATTVLKMNRGEEQHGQSSNKSLDLLSCVRSNAGPSPWLQCSKESKEATAQSNRQWQKYIVFIISAALRMCGGGRCGAGLSKNGIKAKANFD